MDLLHVRVPVLYGSFSSKRVEEILLTWVNNGGLSEEMLGTPGCPASAPRLFQEGRRGIVNPDAQWREEMLLTRVHKIGLSF